MNRIESRASAAMRRMSASLRWTAELVAVALPSGVKVDTGFLVGLRGSRGVMKADLLQLGQRAGGARDQNSAVQQVVGQFGCERGVREPVRIDVELDKGCCLFPDRIVAGHENHASLHQGRDRIVFNREWSCCVLIVGGIGGGRLSPDDEPVGLEIFAGQSRELILVPYGLIKKRELRRAMGHRNREKIRMFERPY